LDLFAGGPARSGIACGGREELLRLSNAELMQMSEKSDSALNGIEGVSSGCMVTKSLAGLQLTVQNHATPPKPRQWFQRLLRCVPEKSQNLYTPALLYEGGRAL
jgi:hypothetical protein